MDTGISLRTVKEREALIGKFISIPETTNSYGSIEGEILDCNMRFPGSYYVKVRYSIHKEPAEFNLVEGKFSIVAPLWEADALDVGPFPPAYRPSVDAYGNDVDRYWYL